MKLFLKPWSLEAFSAQFDETFDAMETNMEFFSNLD